MNGPPVCPGEKTENAPTWRPRKHNFRTRFSPPFSQFYPPIYHPNPSNPYNQFQYIILFYISKTSLNCKIGKQSTTNSNLSLFYYNP